ncbi:MAG: M14 family zinc carboxypeptidase [Bacteroidetes bacterium]|nr:M14 family zinc carboxypeptidase [Bacteroidota bacterium]
MFILKIFIKRVVSILLLLGMTIPVFGQSDTYSRAKINTDELGLKKLAELGIPIDEGIIKKGVYIISDFSDTDLQKIMSNGFTVEILINDMSAYYQDRNTRQSESIGSDAQLRDYQIPDDFSLGSMGGFCTYEEMLAHLDSMAAKYPTLITARAPIGDILTHDGRPLYWVKISDNPQVNEDEPEVFYTGLHHAREPIGMQQLLFFMYYLLENYDTDPNIKNLVDNRELYFVPVVNPDGYIYNQETNPNGGGMWRKNMRDNGDGSYGVDLNRNYGYMWAYDDEGSSPYTWADTYRGPDAFSEPEPQAIKLFCEEHNFQFAFNYHSFGNDYLYPFGYTHIYTPEPDDQIFQAYAQAMTVDNDFLTGTPWEILYSTNGDANDWLYGEQLTKNKIFGVTPEVGTEDDGFWPASDRIIPLCQETMLMNLLAAYYVGAYAEVKNISPSIIEQTYGYFLFDLKRLGLNNNGTYTVSISPVGDEIQNIGEPKVFTGLEILQSLTDSIGFSLNPDISSGQAITYILSIYNGFFTTSDTIHKVYGVPVTVFEDDCNALINWNAGSWGISTTQFHSPTGSITDSPFGNYQNNITSSITLNQFIDLSTAEYAVLNFWTRWAIEARWDYVQVKASSNGGITWIPLNGKYTKPGNSNQLPGQPLYDGFQTNWVKEEIDLHQFLGDSIIIRFTLVSDASSREDGYYFDDLSVTIIDIYSGIGENIMPDQIILSGPVPNPANSEVRITYSLPRLMSNTRMVMCNALGQKTAEVIIKNESGSVTFNVESWQPGIYYYILTGPFGSSQAKKLIIQ